MASTQEKETKDKPTCFIAMPISTPPELVERYGGEPDHFKHVMEQLFYPAIDAAGMEIIPTVATGAENIHAEIITALQTADMVLVDLSTLNANVLFEYGVRSCLNLPACPVRDEFTKDVPFDTTTINTPFYDSKMRLWKSKAAIEELAEHLRVSVKKSQGKNALWRHFGLTKGADPLEPPKGDEKLDALIAEVSNIANKVEALSGSSGGARHGINPALARAMESDLSSIAAGYGVRIKDLTYARNTTFVFLDAGMEPEAVEKFRNHVRKMGDLSRYNFIVA